MKVNGHKRRTRQTGTSVVLLDSRQKENAVFATESRRPWVLVCLDHQKLSRYKRRVDACAVFSKPLQWCETCRKKAGFKPLPKPPEAIACDFEVPRRPDGQPLLLDAECEPVAGIVEQHIPRIAPLIRLFDGFSPVCPHPLRWDTVEATLAQWRHVYTLYLPNDVRKQVGPAAMQWMRARYVLYVHHVYGVVIQEAVRRAEAGQELVEAMDSLPEVATAREGD